MEPNYEPNNQRATLGCGTLILIALIVMIFSGGGISVSKSDVGRLKSDIQNLRTTLDVQSHEIWQLRNVIEKQNKVLKSLPQRAEKD